MKTDALFYRLFQEIPDCYFELIGADASKAADYTFASEELKQAGLRLDGIFLPRRQGPVHFLEVQFYKTPHAYSNLFAKVFLWLEKKGPARDWHACIIFASRDLEPAETGPYQPLLDSGKVTRIFLDELPEPGPDQFGLGILQIIASTPAGAADRAKVWLERTARAERSPDFRRKVVELVETVVLGHFPKLSRVELERMLQLKDLRETKVYREAVEEGLEQGREQGLEQGMEKGRREERVEIAKRLLATPLPLEEIAEVTGLPIGDVKKLKKKARK